MIEINPSTGVETSVASIPQYAYGLTTDGNHLYFFTVGEVFKMTVPGYVVTSLAGDNSDSNHVDGAGASARFRQIFNLHYAEGFLWAADFGSNTLRRIDPNTGTTTTVAGADQQSAVVDGVGTAARFEQIGWMGYHNGSFYFVDGDCTLRSYKISSNKVAYVAGKAGQCSSVMGSSSASSYESSGPGFSLGGKLYFADRMDSIIRVIN